MMNRALDKRKSVIQSYNLIADEFQHTRNKPWQSIREIGDCAGKKILDLGAGTGRNTFELVRMGAQTVVAADISIEMLRILKINCKEEKDKIHIIRCDALYLPFRANSFDSVACIATIHHIPGMENREKAMREVALVMVEDGIAVITAWSRFQRRFLKSSKELLLKPPLKGERGDLMIAWGKTTKRFYHLFSKSELSEVVKKSGLLINKVYGEKIQSKIMPENWVAVARKGKCIGKGYTKHS